MMVMIIEMIVLLNEDETISFNEEMCRKGQQRKILQVALPQVSNLLTFLKRLLLTGYIYLPGKMVLRDYKSPHHGKPSCCIWDKLTFRWLNRINDSPSFFIRDSTHLLCFCS